MIPVTVIKAGPCVVVQSKTAQTDGYEAVQLAWEPVADRREPCRIASCRFEGQTVPFKIQYRYRPAEYGDQLVRMYLLTNDKPSKLGTTPLPDARQHFRAHPVNILSGIAGMLGRHHVRPQIRRDDV